MDPRETVAELTAKAHEISQSAGSKVAAAMKDVIGAAAGLTGFAVESARDLIQYMVRRGQMTQIEGDKLLREVEAAHGTRKPPVRADDSRIGRPAPTAGHGKGAAAPAATRPTPKQPADAKASAVVPKTAKKGASAPAAKSAAGASSKTASKKGDEKPDTKVKASRKKAAEKAATPAAPAATKAAAKAPAKKGSAKKGTATGSAARSESPTRPRAASRAAPAKKRK